MRSWWRREEVQKFKSPKISGSQGPSIPKTHGPKDPWSQDQDITVRFKYKLDSKEGQSCLHGCKPKISPTVILMENLSLRGE